MAVSDVFIVASPNETHVKWIEIIKSFGSEKYIFCEKPPASDLKELSKISEYNPKIFFNFNYRYSLLSNKTKNFIESGELGKVVYASFISSHGLAFKKDFRDNWRFKGNNLASSIIGNLGIHYIDLIGFLFGDIVDIKIEKKNIVSEVMPDSAYISASSELCQSNIFLSYAAPFRNEATIIFDDGILHLLNGKLTIQSPRDIFDNEQRFKPAESIAIDTQFNDSRSYYDDSLINSISHFFDYVSDNKCFPPEDYDKSIRTNQIILDQIA